MTHSTANSPEKAPKTPSLDAQMLEKVHPTSKSFAEIFHSPNDFCIPIKSISTFKGEKAIRFSKEEVNLLSKPFKYTLVGKFTHGNQGLDRISNFLDKVGLQADFSVGFLDKKHVLLRFHHEEDFLRIWMGKQWLIDGRPMRVLRWSYDFKPGSEPTTTTVWVELHLLPIHLYNKSSLFSIASAFGTPLMLDTATANLSRPNLARICIEIDLSKTLTNRVWIGYGIEGNEEGFWQQCVYEQLPKFCNFCRNVGHNEHECKVSEEMPQGKKQRNWVKCLKQTKKKDKNRGLHGSYWHKKDYQSSFNKGKKKGTYKWVEKVNKKDESSFEIPIHNNFQILEEQDLTENSFISVEKPGSSALDKQQERELEFVADQEDFLANRESFINQSVTSGKDISNVSVVKEAPLKVSIRNPITLEEVILERIERPLDNPVILKSSSGYVSDSSYETLEEEQRGNYSPLEELKLLPFHKDAIEQSSSNEAQLILHDEELVVDLTPRVAESEEAWIKPKKIAKRKGVGVSKNTEKVKIHRYNTRLRSRSSDHYWETLW